MDIFTLIGLAANIIALILFLDWVMTKIRQRNK